MTDWITKKDSEEKKNWITKKDEPKEKKNWITKKDSEEIQDRERVNKKSGGRVNFRGGGICKKGMNKKARGANS